MTEGDDQLELIPAPRSRARPQKPSPTAAADRPVARVVVDTGLVHLDRPFDYLVPADLDERAVPGCRVKVRFAGQQTDGFVIERVDATNHEGRLAFLAKVVSSEVVLTPEVLALARAVADRYAGTIGDVLRLAIPPRHATTERRRSEPRTCDAEPDPIVWADHTDGVDLLRRIRDGESPRVVWTALPHPDPALLAAHAALAAVRSGRGAIVCVPDQRDVDHWSAVFAEVLGDAFVVLTAGQEPADRYAAFLAAARGAVPVVLGTRAAAYAPVVDLGLVMLWDDGDDLFAEPRSPYPHTREVLATRATQSACALVIGGHARTAEAQSLVEAGWCTEVIGDLGARRTAWPRVELTDGTETGGLPVRLPRAVFAAIRSADSVLVQVPRRGYRTSLACQSCRTSARCSACEGPLLQSGAGRAPVCRWCGVASDPWACRVCGATQLRAPTVGQLRTAEEFARAFADHAVVTSGGDTVLAQAPEGRVIVLATPGAEPRGEYDVVVLLDTWLMLARDDVRVVEESHRRWFNALALARPGAHAVVVGEPTLLQALVRADPVGFSRRELDDRRQTHLPPVGRLASVDADPELLADLAGRIWTEHTEVLGPVPLEPPRSAAPTETRERLILRAPRREGPALAAALHQVAADRSAAKLPVPRIQVDPQRF